MFDRYVEIADVLVDQVGAPDRIAIHCQGTEFGSSGNTADAIHRYHVNERGYSAIGYHVVIEEDGSVVQGRPIGKRGAHCPQGQYNSKGIGICLTGGLKDGKPSDAFKREQWGALREVVSGFVEEFRIDWDLVKGHRDIIREFGGRAKACPCFDVQAWLIGNEVRPRFREDVVSEDVHSDVDLSKRYTVVEGDTLYRISRLYGVPLSVLSDLNGLEDENIIRPGQVLLLQ